MKTKTVANKGTNRTASLEAAGWVEDVEYLEACYLVRGKAGDGKIWCDLRYSKTKQRGGLEVRLNKQHLPADVKAELTEQELEQWWAPSPLLKLLGSKALVTCPKVSVNGYLHLHYRNDECTAAEDAKPGVPPTHNALGALGVHDDASEKTQSDPPPPNPIWTRIAEWANGFGLHVAATERPPCFNLILEGVPGTGKTYSLDRLRKKWTEDSGQTGDSQLKDGQKKAAAELAQGRFAMTMHPATAYEDFVEGLRPGAPALPTFADGEKPQAHGYGDEKTVWFFTNSANDKPKSNPTQTTGFQVHDGFFVRVCREAVHYPDRVFVVLLDEINRCNIPKVLGDLLTTIEASKRARYTDGKWNVTNAQVMTLPYSQRSFFVPDNVVVVGTMNTTDRSVAPMDAALRRRFAFARVYPQGFEYGKTPEKAPADLLTIESSWMLWRELNEYLRQFGEDAMLGHSYLHALASDTKHTDPNVIRSHWNHYIFPQLVDILVSNDLLDKALGSKDVTDVKKINYKFPTDSGVNEAAGKVGNLTITVNGKGLLRTPSIRLERPVSSGSSVGDQQKQPEFSGGPSSTTQEIESGGEQAQ